MARQMTFEAGLIRDENRVYNDLGAPELLEQDNAVSRAASRIVASYYKEAGIGVTFATAEDRELWWKLVKQHEQRRQWPPLDDEPEPA